MISPPSKLCVIKHLLFLKVSVLICQFLGIPLKKGFLNMKHLPAAKGCELVDLR